MRLFFWRKIPPGPAVLALALGLTAGCALIPSTPTACSATRPCPSGQVCDPDTSTCKDSQVSPGPPEPPIPDMPTCTQNCTPCAMNADCTSGVCDVYVTTQGQGTCIPQQNVVYVDNHNGTCTKSGDGNSPGSALCTLVPEAVTKVQKDQTKTAIRLMASTASYGNVSFTDVVVAIYGPAGEPEGPMMNSRAQLGGTGTDVVTLNGTAQVTLYGLDITGGHAGVNCYGNGQSTGIYVHKSRISGCTDVGVTADSCAVEIDRTLIYNNAGAVAIARSPGFNVTNNFMVKNATSAQTATVRVYLSTTGWFRFNTVADNQMMKTFGIAAIQCGHTVDSHLNIDDSIVVNNWMEEFSQFSGNCTVRNSVVGRDILQGPGIINKTPMFVGPRMGTVPDIDRQYALSTMGPMPNACCIDQAQGVIPFDYFGTRRPLGLAGLYDIGADEAQ